MKINAAASRAVFSLLILAHISSPAQESRPEYPQERSIFAATNAARIQHGLQPLAWDSTLAAAARAHDEVMAQESQLSHQYRGEDPLDARAAQAGAHFQTIAENIALGRDVETLQQEWMHSPPHRANILDPALNAMGVAVIRNRGELYAVVDFSRSVRALTKEQVEGQVSALLAQHRIAVTGATQDARQTCEMEHGGAGGSEPLFRMRWQSSDLSRLPPVLETELKSKKYRSAAVGACSSTNTQGTFTTFRVAVLLF